MSRGTVSKASATFSVCSFFSSHKKVCTCLIVEGIQRNSQILGPKSEADWVPLKTVSLHGTTN